MNWTNVTNSSKIDPFFSKALLKFPTISIIQKWYNSDNRIYMININCNVFNNILYSKCIFYIYIYRKSTLYSQVYFILSVSYYFDDTKTCMLYLINDYDAAFIASIGFFFFITFVPPCPLVLVLHFFCFFLMFGPIYAYLD